MNEQRSYSSMDVMRFLLAALTIMAHTQPLEHVNSALLHRLLDRSILMIVPFFFLSTGYFLGKRMQEKEDAESRTAAIRKTLFKTGKLYLFWSLIYLPLALVEYVRNAVPVKDAIQNYVQYLLFFGEHYNSWMLWYLLSACYGLAMILVLQKHRVSIKKICVCGALVFLIGQWINMFVYEPSLPPLLSILQKGIRYTFVNGRITKGCLYLPLGILLAEEKELPAVPSAGIALGCFVLACAVRQELLVELLIAVSSAALFEALPGWKLKEHRIYPVIRKMSSHMYFLHMYLWTGLYMVLYGEKTFGLRISALTLLAAILLSFLLVSVPQKKNKVEGSRGQNS